MPCRHVKLVKGQLYHIYSKSIADFVIFNTDKDYERIQDELLFYSIGKPGNNFSSFRELKKISGIENIIKNGKDSKIVEMISYCIMPTHIHLLLKEIKNDGIEKFMESILKSYSRYFNIKHNRKGPLWQNRFGNVLIENDDQLVHLTRYIHLNPATDYIVNNPKDWIYSSYREYIGITKEESRICSFSAYLNMDASSYEKFVNDQIDYQRSLALLKKITIS